MIERIAAGNNLLALVVRGEGKRMGANFVTSKKSPLQLGISKYRKKHAILPHVHNKPLRHIRTTQEIIYIVKGKIKVDLYYKDKKVATKILKSGDLILLIGAHGFKFLSDTKIIEVKQGPYVDKKTDKRYLRV